MKRLLAAVAAVTTASLLLAPAASARTLPARTDDRAALRSLVDAVTAAGVTGAVLRVTQDGRSRTVTSGTADLRTHAALRGDEEVRVGSITKTFMAVLALQLVERGRLRLDDTVATWLPGAVHDGDRITVRMLLNHTSGVFDYTEDDSFVGGLIDDAVATGTLRSVTPAELVAVADAHPALFAPGTRFSYSNTNYVLLGLVLEKAGRASVARQLARRITGPLDLEHTYLPSDGTWRGRHAHGYLPGALLGVQEPFVDTSDWNPSWAWTAGSLVSNAADLDRFYTALLSGKLLPRRVVARMQTGGAPTGQPFTYGLGLLSVHAPCGTFWGHDGSIPGYASTALTSPDGSRSVVLLTTTDLDERSSAAVNEALAAALCPTG